MADERPPPEGRVELDVGPEVPLLAREPREHYHDPSPALLAPPVPPPALPPHLQNPQPRSLTAFDPQPRWEACNLLRRGACGGSFGVFPGGVMRTREGSEGFLMVMSSFSVSLRSLFYHFMGCLKKRRHKILWILLSYFVYCMYTYNI